MTRSQRVAFWAISAVLLLTIVRFAAYVADPDHLPRNLGAGPTALDVVLLAVLCFVLLQNTAMALLTWVMTGLLQRAPRRRRRGLPGLPDARSTRVAFITTFVPGSEPLEMLAQTLKAMTLADYPHDTWVLDEGGDERVQRLCRLIGVKYFTRHGVERWNTHGGTFSAKTKGGNHNAWYEAHGLQYDFVAQIDTDFLPRRDFLTRTLREFADQKIGWVGTPQIYGNTESFLARGAAEQTYGFYGPIMRGLSTFDSTLLIGANHVIRVAALREAGLYFAHLTEDLATGMTLHARGWRSVYVAEPLAVGEGPTQWGAYFKQQFRWAKGSIDLHLTRSPGLLRRMRPSQIGAYAWLLSFYWNGAAFGLGIVLLLLHLTLGWDAIRGDGLAFADVYLPLMLAVEAASLWTQRFNVRPGVERGLLVRCRLLTVAAMPVYLAAFLAALRDLGQHTEFEVTQKGAAGPAPAARGTGRRKKGGVLRPHFLVTVVVLAGAGLGLVLGHLEPAGLLWAAAALVPGAIVLFRPKWQIVRFRVRRMRRSHRAVLVRLDAALSDIAARTPAVLPDPGLRSVAIAAVRGDLAALSADSTPLAEVIPLPTGRVA